MPTYDYHCSANSQTVTVQHGMKDKLSTWGELCQRAEIQPGDTPADAPVERLITGGLLTIFGSSGTASSAGVSSAPHHSGPCCGNPASCRH